MAYYQKEQINKRMIFENLLFNNNLIYFVKMVYSIFFIYLIRGFTCY